MFEAGDIYKDIYKEIIVVVRLILVKRSRCRRKLSDSQKETKTS
jgi:hypothetical protein